MGIGKRFRFFIQLHGTFATRLPVTVRIGKIMAHPAARDVVRIPACRAGIGLGGVAAVGVSAVGMSAAALCVFGFFAFCRFCRAFAQCRIQCGSAYGGTGFYIGLPVGIAACPAVG